MKKTLTAVALATGLFAGQAFAADYAIDKQGQHAFVNFKISHLGYSWLYGTFKDFDGSFSYDPAKPEASKVDVVIKTASIDSNHAERDKHLRSGDFLNTDKHPEASFKSTAVKANAQGGLDITGDFTLNGVTKPVTIAAKHLGEGKDPWGGYRTGFEGTTKLALKDFNIQKDLGPASQEVEIILSIEGVKK